MIEAIFHGHSFVEIAYDSGSIYIDPFITGNSQCDLTLESAKQRSVQAIVITHGHDDHIGDTISLAKDLQCQVIATFEVANRLEEQGVENVSSQHIGGTVNYHETFSIKYVPALHGGDITGSSITGVAAGVLVSIGDKLIHHAGDTGLSQEMKLIGEYSPPDVSFVPIGDRFTMGVDDAIIATSFISPKVVVPIHYNTRPIIKADAMDFARRVMLDNYAVPKILKPGQAVVLA